MATILIVEDNPNVLLFIQQVMTDYHTVLEASSGQEALALFEKQPIDLIITDILMPGMDGLQLIKTIRARGSIVPIIACTGTFEPVDIGKQALTAGANLFIGKPFEVKTLRQAVEQLLSASEEPSIITRIKQCSNAELIEALVKLGRTPAELETAGCELISRFENLIVTIIIQTYLRRIRTAPNESVLQELLEKVFITIADNDYELLRELIPVDDKKLEKVVERIAYITARQHLSQQNGRAENKGNGQEPDIK